MEFHLLNKDLWESFGITFEERADLILIYDVDCYWNSLGEIAKEGDSWKLTVPGFTCRAEPRVVCHNLDNWLHGYFFTTDHKEL